MGAGGSGQYRRTRPDLGDAVGAAVTLNRVAAKDASGNLGAALSAQDRDVTALLVARALAEIEEQQQRDLLLCVLVGDQQIRRVIAPDEAAIAARSDWALDMFARAAHGR
ncbi:hypothetical protein [uncultured Sulfitobacter sp.]|uniref:hypothetical protein n=1 Tax=uncultured Sulfitobacter sp. TaxID=191468 RepID=UPI002619DE28|nr:hypothetical protein [uncultured Sulfitobacter sp.]